MSKAIKRETVTFNGTTYGAKVAPAARGRESDPTDVTTLDQDEQHYIPGAIVKNKELTIQVNGVTEEPTINTVGNLVLTVKWTDGTTDTDKTVTIPNCILKGYDPPNPEAGGDRAGWWTFTFQPGGGTSQSQGGGSGSTST